MNVFRYAVIRADGYCQIVSRRSRIGLFSTIAEAAMAAARLGREALLAGHEVEISVEDDGGELQTISFFPSSEKRGDPHLRGELAMRLRRGDRPPA